MKKVLRAVSQVVILLLVIACLVFSIPSLINMVKEISATPPPDEDLTLAAACEYYGQMVQVEGRLEVPNYTTCTSQEPFTCRLELYDPYWQDYAALIVPVYQESGDPPAGQIAMLPEEFDKGDFMIRTADGLYARDGSFVSIRGVENHNSGGGPLCEIASIESIKLLDHLVIDVGVDLSSVTLQEAVEEGLVVATITGSGLSQIRVSLKPKVEVNYEVVIEPGTLFISGTEGVQNMVVRQQQIVYLKPEMEVGFELEVSCANMSLKEPSYSDVFSISSEPVNADLLRLLQSEGFSALDLSVQQFAIWTITDDPYDTYSYTGINRGNSTDHMNDKWVEVLRDQFTQAGIDPVQYRIFNN
jgi:hypothetical protein